jgi:cell wall-associated NlpC family hydrolase
VIILINRMKYFKLILVLVFLSSISVFSQEKYTKHTISKGETISSIAQKYKVKPSVIYELNPDCTGVLKLKSVLLIPTKNTQKNNQLTEKTSAPAEKIHEVQAKETLFGIAKQYGITVNDLYKANPKLDASGLKKGQKITIPQTELVLSEAVIVTSEKETPISEKKILVHEVEAKETKYAIAKQYGITIADLDQINPEIEKSALKVGQKINVPLKEGYVSNPVLKEIPNVEKETLKPEAAIATPNKTPITETITSTQETVVYEVLQNETKYAIAKKYEISIADLDKFNPILESESLKMGQKILIPIKAGFQPLTVKENTVPETQIVVEKQASKEENSISTPIQEVSAAISTKDVEVASTQSSSTAIIHEVLLKETKFGIAKQYGITIAELEKQNPGIKRNLPVGFKLSIRNSNVVLENTITDKPISENVESTVSNDFVRPASTIELIDQLIKTASDNIGTRYRTGGTSKEGFDCSGLMCTTFGTFDIKLPRSSFEQSSFGTKINMEDAQKGDLIFFKTNGRKQINHVGMVVEVIDGEIKFIHSSVSSGVIISSTKEKYYEKNFTQINRVLQ